MINLLAKAGNIFFILGIVCIALIVVVPKFQPFINLHPLGIAVYAFFIGTIACYVIRLGLLLVERFTKPPSEV